MSHSSPTLLTPTRCHTQDVYRHTSSSVAPNHHVVAPPCAAAVRSRANCVNVVIKDQTCVAAGFFFPCLRKAKKRKKRNEKKRKNTTPKTTSFLFSPASCTQAPTVVTSGWSGDLPPFREDGATPHFRPGATEVLKTDQTWISSLGEKLHFFFPGLTQLVVQ